MFCYLSHIQTETKRELLCWFMTHYVASCSTHPFKKQRQTGTSCTAAVCYLIQLHEAALFIQCHVLCVEHHSDRTVKAFTTPWAWGLMSYRCLSLVTTILCPWCWLTENTKISFLSIARFVPGCVLVWSILHIDRITQVIMDQNGTVMTLQQWTAIFREILKTMLGNCKGEPKARSYWMAANPVNLLLHCPANTWHYYLSILIPTFDFLEHFGWVYVCVIITMCILPQDGRDTRRGN